MTKGLHKNSLRKGEPNKWMVDDARMELIQQIKAEVERRIQQIKDAIERESDAEMETYFSGKVISLEEFDFFLSNLEKEEKSIEGLEEYASQIVAELVPSLGQKHLDGSYVGGIRDYFSREELIGLVKAGAKWKMEQSELSCEGLDEEMERFMSNLTEKKGVFPPLTRLGFRAIARHFAQWQKERMLNEAVKGQVIDDGGDFKLVVPSLHTILKGTEDGEMLKLIIIKED